MGANSSFFILNLRLFSRKKQSKVTSPEREESTDMKPHLCNMCDEAFPQSIPQLTRLWWVPPDIQSDFPSDSLITHKEENTRISSSNMVDKMNTFNACSLKSHINVYDTDGQNAVENHLANSMFVNKKLIKLLVIAGEKIGHSYPFRGPLLWICWPEGRSRVIPKCVYNIEKVISPGNHVI